MRRVCPDCQGTFEAQFLCPNCGVQLMALPDPSALAAEAWEESVPRPTIGPRILAGLILSQGLYYGLQQLWVAASMAGMLSENVTSSIRPFFLPALQVLGVLVGGLIAGAGNARGIMAGAAIGLVNALVFLAPMFAHGNRPPDFMLFGAWLPLAVFGAAGGLVARRVWPSLLDLPQPKLARSAQGDKTTKLIEPPAPLAWFRVLGGAALSVGCTVWAGGIRDAIVGSGGGTFIIESRIQAQFVAWAISAIAMIVGGAFAGATSIGGLKHGFLVGLLASCGIFLIHHRIVQEPLPAELFFASIFGLTEYELPPSTQTVLFLLTNTLLLGTLGGWFGSTLLPKVIGGSRGRLDRGSI